MPSPFSYLFDHNKISQTQGNVKTFNGLMDFTDTTATLTEGGSVYDAIETLSLTDGINVLAISDTLPRPVGTPSAPEPTVLLDQIQKAAEDVSQLAGRFGYKMAETVRRNDIKTVLFANPELLQLPCLKYADNFTCRFTTQSAQQPISFTNSAPLLWWLWDELLNFFKPSWPRHCKLEFTPAHKTDIDLPYTISISLSYKDCNDKYNRDIDRPSDGDHLSQSARPRRFRDRWG